MAAVVMATETRGPQKRSLKRGPVLVLALGVIAVAIALAAGVQRCFAAQPAVAAPVLRTLGAAATVSAKVDCDCDFDGELTAAGESFAGAATAPWQSSREPAVVMFNKKSGRKDLSEGWTNRVKFRICSTMARMATKKGRKIINRRKARGKKVGVNTGDYQNPKCERTLKFLFYR